MAQVQVKKVVAVCFVEAAKMTLEHLGEHRLTMSQQGIAGPPDLPRLYGELRRLREYLQRAASAFPEVVDLELNDADRALLIACCRRNVEAIDLRLQGEGGVGNDERQWLQRKRTVLTDWAVELVTRPPLLELPIPRLSPVPTEGSKALLTRLHQRMFPAGGVPMASAAPAAPPAPTSKAVPAGFANSVTIGVEVPYAGELPLAASAAPSSPAAAPASGAAGTPLPLESQRLRDPRLRTLVVMDLNALGRAIAAQDHRLTAVLLASVLEGAMLDHAIPRRAELGLTGTPDTWSLVDVLAKAMGEAFQPQDRAIAFQLFATRNLLRPALQIMSPTAITHAGVDKLMEFVRRALHTMGLASGAGDEPLHREPPILRLEDRRPGPRPSLD